MLLLLNNIAHAQDSIVEKHIGNDSIPVIANDTLAQKNAGGTLFPDTLHPKKLHSPRTAALYSAVLPGLGQAYNHKYWKIPIAYAGLGVATGVFVYNYKMYILFRDAYRLSFSGKKTGNDFVDQYDPQNQKRIRDIFRQYVDYSALAFIGVYAINIIDAIVDAHLYYFNVSNDISVKLSPVIQSHYAGIGIVFQLDKKRKSKYHLPDVAVMHPAP